MYKYVYRIQGTIKKVFVLGVRLIIIKGRGLSYETDIIHETVFARSTSLTELLYRFFRVIFTPIIIS